MRQRNPFLVFLLPLVTFGIYNLYWLVSTKREMVRQGQNIPTSWLIIIPIVSLYWLWRWCAGAEGVTNGKMNGVLAFVLQWFLGSIGSAIVQDAFNKAGDGATVSMQPAAAPVSSDNTVPPAAGPTVQ